MRSGKLALMCAAAVLAAACSGGAPEQARATETPSPTPSPTPTPSPSPSGAASYFAPLTGYEYVPLPAVSLTAMRNSIESNATYKQYFLDFGGNSVTRSGEPLGLTIFVFQIDPSLTALAGARDAIAKGAVGNAPSVVLNLGGRPVTFWETASGKQYFWLHKNFMVLSLATDRVKAEPVLKALIDANTPESRYILSGQVTSAATSQALPNVTIALDFGGDVRCCVSALPTVRTNDQGRFTINGILEGTYRLVAIPTADGYGARWFGGAPDFSRATDVVVNRNTSLIDIALPVGYNVVGTIRGPNGPLAQASVFAYGPPEAGTDNPLVMSAFTDANGRFTLRLADGSYRLLFDGPAGSALARQWWKGATAYASATELLVRGAAPPSIAITLAAR